MGLRTKELLCLPRVNGMQASSVLPSWTLPRRSGAPPSLKKVRASVLEVKSAKPWPRHAPVKAKGLNPGHTEDSPVKLVKHKLWSHPDLLSQPGRGGCGSCKWCWYLAKARPGEAWPTSTLLACPKRGKADK